MSLTLYNYEGSILYTFPIATGKLMGNKLVKGDLRTPEGVFPIINIQDSRDWEYDFEGDHAPAIKGAYGPWFFRIRTSSDELFNNSITDPSFTEGNKFLGLGIHGTHDSTTVGTRSSHGCVRMKNADIALLKNHVFIGMRVIILPSIEDQKVNQQVE